MPGRFTIQETLHTLIAIFEKHQEERVCVLGTICAGKTTLLTQLSEYGCEDLDAVLWPNLPEEETAFLNQTPWTEEMGAKIDRLVYQYVRVRPGHPLFTTVIVDCEAVVYLDISDVLLEAHCDKRGISFSETRRIKESVEEDWNSHKDRHDKIMYYVSMTE